MIDWFIPGFWHHVWFDNKIYSLLTICFPPDYAIVGTWSENKWKVKFVTLIEFSQHNRYGQIMNWVSQRPHEHLIWHCAMEQRW
jgi:hypothetical protein